MIPYTTLLEEALEAWADCRAGVVEELQILDDAELEFRPADGARSGRELVWHIVETARMWCGELARADGDFRRQSFGEFIQEYGGEVTAAHDRDALLELLESSHRDGDRSLRDAGELRMLQTIHRFDGVPGTRLAWLNHGIAHEMYHRGQLAMYARLIGRTPALTQRIG